MTSAACHESRFECISSSRRPVRSASENFSTPPGLTIVIASPLRTRTSAQLVSTLDARFSSRDTLRSLLFYASDIAKSSIVKILSNFYSAITFGRPMACAARLPRPGYHSFSMNNLPHILDGVAIASEIKAEVAREVADLTSRGIRPGLAVILVGEVPASQIYVRSKVKTCGELGIYSEMLTPPESITTEAMLSLVADLNAREDIDGILIQLPLPKHVDTKRLLEAVSPDKDVDGFHPINSGRLLAGLPALAPCTPAGIIEILNRSDLPIAGKHAVVVGRSDIVGKPA